MLGIPKSGRARFNACRHQQFDFTPDTATLTCPETKRTGTIVQSEAIFADNALATETRDGVEYDGDRAATKHLSQVAGDIMCKGCDLYRLSPEELDTRLAERTEARARLLNARAAEMRAEHTLQATIAELNGAYPIDPAPLQSPQPPTIQR